MNAGMNAGMNAFQYIHTVKGYIRELEQETGALLKIRELLVSGQEFDDSDLESILDEAGRPVTPSLNSVLRKLDEVDKEIALLKRQSMSKEDQELLETSIELLGSEEVQLISDDLLNQRISHMDKLVFLCLDHLNSQQVALVENSVASWFTEIRRRKEGL